MEIKNFVILNKTQKTLIAKTNNVSVYGKFYTNDKLLTYSTYGYSIIKDINMKNFLNIYIKSKSFTINKTLINPRQRIFYINVHPKLIKFYKGFKRI